jgi:hypothetical protein
MAACAGKKSTSLVMVRLKINEKFRKIKISINMEFLYGNNVLTELRKER